MFVTAGGGSTRVQDNWNAWPQVHGRVLRSGLCWSCHSAQTLSMSSPNFLPFKTKLDLFPIDPGLEIKNWDPLTLGVSSVIDKVTLIQVWLPMG